MRDPAYWGKLTQASLHLLVENCIYVLTRDSAGEESDALEVEVPDRAEHVPLAEGPVGAEEELNETLDVWEVERRLHLHGRPER